MFNLGSVTNCLFPSNSCAALSLSQHLDTISNPNPKITLQIWDWEITAKQISTHQFFFFTQFQPSTLYIHPPQTLNFRLISTFYVVYSHGTFSSFTPHFSSFPLTLLLFFFLPPAPSSPFQSLRFFSQNFPFFEFF